MFERSLAALGALFCAAATALSAYAAHAVDELARARLQPAALFLFLNGIGLLVLTQRRAPGLRWASLGIALGTLLFSGSLVMVALSGGSASLAPFGGSLLILAWLGAAALLLRKD